MAKGQKTNCGFTKFEFLCLTKKFDRRRVLGISGWKLKHGKRTPVCWVAVCAWVGVGLGYYWEGVR